MKKCVLALCIILFSVGIHAEQETSVSKNVEKSLIAYIDFFHSKLCDKLKEKYSSEAKKMIPYIIMYSEKYSVDPFLVACIIRFESSWRNFNGNLGEFGPMQVMPSKWSRQFDTETLEGQLEAGIARLSLAQKKCKTLEGALTHYASGRCVSKSERTKKKIRYRMNHYIKMRERFGSNDFSNQ